MMHSKNIRVLVAAPDYPYPVIGGLQKQAHELNKELLTLGCELLVITGKHDADGASEEVVDRVRVKRAPYLRLKRLRLLFNALWAVWQVLLRAGRYDVIHIHNLSTFGALVAVAGWLRRTPVMMKLPNVGRLGIPGLRGYVLGDGVLLMLKCVSAFVAMSEESVRELAEIGTPERKVFKVVNGINLRAFDEACGESCRSGLKDLKVIFTGRLMQTKGVADLLKAWSRLQEEGLFVRADVPVRLHLVGDGPDRERLLGITSELQVQDTVVFEGYCSDIPRQLSQSSIFVLPSYSEGNSNSILEAMSAGLPVVSTDVGGTSLLLGPEASEYVLEPGDVDGLAARLKYLIESVGIREALSTYMRSRVEGHFDIRVVANAYYAAYSELRRSRSSDMTPFASDVFRQEI